MQTIHGSTISARSVLSIVGIALAFAGCSGGGDKTAPAASVLTSVGVTSPAQSVVAGQTLQFVATPRDQSGNAFSAALSWASSAPTIAFVSPSGLVTGQSAGAATISATATSGTTVVTGTASVTVTPAPVLTTVTITAPSTSIATNATTQLAASAKDQFGASIAATVTWSSSASGTAAVSSSGQVTGVAGGSATITATATAGGVTVTANVLITVVAPVLTSVTISAGSSSVAVAGTSQFTAAPKDQNGSAIAATLTWNSSVPAKATISNTGLVTGVALGTTNITVSATAGGVTVGSPSSVVTVTSAFASSASVNATLSNTFSPSSVDIAAGGIVTWNFATQHNVTFNVAVGAPADIPTTSSGSAGATFTTAGTFNYQCTIHAGMTGVVIVH